MGKYQIVQLDSIVSYHKPIKLYKIIQKIKLSYKKIININPNQLVIILKMIIINFILIKIILFRKMNLDKLKLFRII